MPNRSNTLGAVVLAEQESINSIMIPSYTCRDTRKPIDRRNLEEAASIVEKYPTPESLIAKIQWAVNLDTDVGYTLYARYKAIYLRGIEINAWSQSLDTHYDKMLVDKQDSIASIAAKQLGLGHLLNDQIVISNKFMPLFFLPYSSTYLELYSRLKKGPGAGLLGFLVTGVENAFLFVGTNHAKATYDWMASNPKADAGSVCCFYTNGDELVYEHGILSISMPLELAYVYIAIMFNSAIHTPRHLVKKKQLASSAGPLVGNNDLDASLNYTSRLLDDFYIGGAYSREYPYRVFFLQQGGVDTDSKREQIGDFWGYGVCEYYCSPKFVVENGKILQIGSDGFSKLMRKGFESTRTMDTIIKNSKSDIVFTPDKKWSDVEKFLKEKYFNDSYDWKDLWGLDITTLLNNQYYRMSK